MTKQDISIEVRDWQQGDYFELERPIEIPQSIDDNSQNKQCFSIVALVSQTCDVVANPIRRPYVKVAPAKIDENAAGGARIDRWHQYAYLPGFDVNGVVSLDQITTVPKSLLASQRKGRGCRTDLELRRFQRAVGRHFRRFAYPDDLRDSLNNFVKHLEIGRKAGNPESAPLDELLQIRAAVPSREWTSNNLNVELTFLIKTELHPVDLDVGEPAEINEARKWAVGKTCCQIAQRLENESEVLVQFPLWEALAAAWARLAEPQGQVASVNGVVADVFTFTAEQMINSDQLELDYLTRTEDPQSL